MARYSYSCQYAESEIDQVDDRGAASPAQIMAAFDAFDWSGQVSAANHLQRCSPTFSVFDAEADRQFWVSGTGEPGKLSFVNQYTYQGEVRRLLGLLRSTGAVCPRSRQLSLAEARGSIELFVSGDREGLLKLIS